VNVSHKPIRFDASSEDMLRHEINELALKILGCSNRRDVLIGRVVAIETKGLDYTEAKAYSLGIRWYSCKDYESFKQGYREGRTHTNPQAGKGRQAF